MKGMINKSAQIVVKNYDDVERTVSGYASVFNNLDSDKDVIKSGAFNKTIKEWGPGGKKRIKLVSQHNIGKPVAKIDDLYEDEKGLYMKATFGTHQDGEDHYRMVKEGILTEFSIGFVPTQEEKNDDGGRYFKEVKLYEVSLVTVAANDAALVTDVKGATTPDESDILDGMLKLVSKLDNEDIAFKLERDLHTLKSQTQETITKPESDLAVKEDSVKPKVESKDDFKTMLDYL